MDTSKLTKVDALNEYAELLLNNGFTIIAPETPSTYFHFSKDNKIGYVQTDRFLRTTFSTVHKPCKECGTGYRMSGEYAPLDLDNALQALKRAPTWARSSDVKAIVKYKDVAEFTAQYFHKNDLVLTPNNA